MIDPELKKEIQNVNNSVQSLGSRWRALSNGVLGGFGYIIGAFLALLIIGWILNALGVIPALRNEVDQWQKLLKQSQPSQLQSRINNNQ